MRIATWNVNSVLARLPRLTVWLEETAPDVVCLQETKVGADAFPAGEVTKLGYEIAAHGEGRWNGVAILSKAGLASIERVSVRDPNRRAYVRHMHPREGPPATADGIERRF